MENNLRKEQMEKTMLRNQSGPCIFAQADDRKVPSRYTTMMETIFPNH